MIRSLRRKRRRLRPSHSEPSTALLGGRNLAERIATFQSMGSNCEFGFVQRYCGVESSGLFRFAYTDIEPLTHAVANSFERYGAPSDLRLEQTESGVYYCVSNHYNFWYNTPQLVGTVDESLFLEDQYGKVAHLKRRLLRDLAEGAKILVRKPNPDEDRDAFLRLAEAVWKHGPSTMLRVTESDAGQTTLHRSAERLLEGTVSRFSPREQSFEIDLESWVALCDAAYAAHHELQPAKVAAPSLGDAAHLSGLRRHDARAPGHVLNAFTELLDLGAFDPAALYVFSAWVWIPAEFSASCVFAAVGTERLGRRDADLSQRECWQRVWAAGRIVADAPHRPSAGLGLIGEPGNHVWSCGWELREGAVPAPSALPTLSVEPSLLSRLLRR